MRGRFPLPDPGLEVQGQRDQPDATVMHAAGFDDVPGDQTGPRGMVAGKMGPGWVSWVRFVDFFPQCLKQSPKGMQLDIFQKMAAVFQPIISP